MELSRVLNTGLNEEAIRSIRDLCDLGINPNALAAAVRELREMDATIVAQ